MLFNASPHAQQHQDRRNQDRPQRNGQNGEIKGGPSGRRDGGQFQDQQQISRQPMVLVETSSPVGAAQDQSREKVLHDAAEGLENNQNIRDQAENPMGRGQSRVIALVHLDDDEGGDKGDQTDGLQGVVHASAQSLLLGSDSGLENECGLDL